MNLVTSEPVEEKLLYICGGRSFYSENLGRKIAEVVACWRQAEFDVRIICGGDLLNGDVSASKGYGAQDTYASWYRGVAVLDPFVTSLSEWRDIRHDKAMLLRLRYECAERKPKVIWERSSRLHNAGLLLAKELNVPYVLEWKDHLVDYRYSLFRQRALGIEAMKIREADYIVVESEVLRRKLVEQEVDGSKVLVAHNAVTATEFTPELENREQVRKRLGVTGDTVLVGYLGSYAFYHDAERLILAANILRDKGCDKEVKFLMVGAGKDYEHCRKLAEEMSLLNTTVIMRPGVPKDKVPSILAALDIAVLPGSTNIICPIKVQEYMACGLPSVVPDYECTREVVREGRTGILFSPHDEEALAEKVRMLAENMGMRERIGSEARKEVQRRFTWERTWGAALNHIMVQL